ncbi:hypothetical protein ACIBEF_32095 [Micromonospora sp. NPDC050795]|uniref:hypothetical protein n=1 Tax=Micromonospora sp. NPDC050795 TaxID=3364282 RepID=UPI0037923A16
MQSNTGFLFRPSFTGVTSRIDIDPTETVVNGDGLWLRGEDLYVAQNRLYVIAKIEIKRHQLNPRATSNVVRVGPQRQPSPLRRRKLLRVQTNCGPH